MWRHGKGSARKRFVVLQQCQHCKHVVGVAPHMHLHIYTISVRTAYADLWVLVFVVATRDEQID